MTTKTESKWAAAIHKTPQPGAGVLTERALAQAPQKPRRTLRPYAYGSLALAATLPVAFFLLPKISTQSHKAVALTQEKQVTTQEKQVTTQEKQVTTQEKQVTTQEKSMPTQEKSMPTQEKLLAKSEIATFGVQERVVQANEELLLRLAQRRNLSALSASFGERGAQLAFGEGKQLAEREWEGTSLTPLPSAPSYESAQLKTTLARWPDGNVEGTLLLATPSRGGAIPKTYLVYVAAFDAKGTLVSTVQTELPGAGGTANVKLGLAPTAQHYQLALFAKPSPPKDELIVAGWWVQHLEGKVPPPLTGTYGENTFSLVTLGEPHVIQNNYYKNVVATLTASVASLSDAVGYTVHGALFDEKGALLSTDQEPLKPEVSLSFGVTGQHAARYQLAVTAPAPKPINFRLGEHLVAQAQQSLALQPQTARDAIALNRNTFNLNLNLSSLSTLSEAPVKAPDASFTVASVTTEPDGSLVLLPPPCPNSMEEILKNPELRDYTQIKLTPSVVVALKAKGITKFIGKSIQASGKSESVLNLSRPAFEVTTVMVEKAEDFQVISQPLLIRLRAAKDHQARYELLISPEFHETLLAAAQRGDEATVIELVQWSWFGGPQEAAKGGNGVTWAAYCPTLEPVKALLERGVPAGVADASGNTGLHRTYRPEIAELLLKHKAPTETKNSEGETPLIAQARQADRWLGRLGVVQALLSAGANPNATDNQWRTPLMWAAKSGLPDFVEALLKRGADPKRKDKDGKTARNYITAWQWGTAPGFLTPDGAKQLQRDSEADRARVEQLLGAHAVRQKE